MDIQYSPDFFDVQNYILHTFWISKNKFWISINREQIVKLHPIGIHVYIETGNKLNLDEISQVIRYDLEKLHKINIHSVVFLQLNTFNKYTCKN